MFRSRLTVTGAALAAALGAAFAAAAPGTAAARARPASGAAVLKVAVVKVAIRSTNRPHRLLVDARGLPVYMLTGDSISHPLCRGNCLTYWPAVTTTSKHPLLGKGVSGKVGVWHHNKISQVTLDGHPLYTFAQDSRGAALGEGLKSFGGVWRVLTATGTPMAKSSSRSGGKSSTGAGW